MQKFQQYWNGFTPGVRVVLIFMATMTVGLAWAAFTGQLHPTPAAVVSAQDVALNKARNSAMNNAMDLCETTVSRAATNRSSVKFLGVADDPRIRQDGSGRFIVTTRFSAKNGFGSESINTARCVVSDDGQSLIEMTTQDSR